jgi:hypothetical protein
MRVVVTKRKAGQQVRLFHTDANENKCINNGMRLSRKLSPTSHQCWGQGKCPMSNSQGPSNDQSSNLKPKRSGLAARALVRNVE